MTENVLSYREMAEILHERLHESSRLCVMGGRCEALDAMRDTIDRVFDGMEKQYDQVVLEEDPPATRPRGALRGYDEMYATIREALQRSYPRCLATDRCPALNRMDEEVGTYFRNLAKGNDYLVLARDATARRIRANHSANRAVIAAHVEARKDWPGRLIGTATDLIRQDRDS